MLDGILVRSGGRFRVGGVEQPATERELGGAVAIGEEAIVTDAVEAVRQGVHQEAADELVGTETDRPTKNAVVSTMRSQFWRRMPR